MTGILRPFGNSQFVTPDVMLSFEEWAPLVYGWDGVLKRGYASASFPLYLMLKPHADLSAKMPDMLSHLKTYYWPYKDDHARELTIIPLTEVYLSNPLYASEQIRIGSKTLINTFFSVAMLILLFAVINYINLSTAQSESRAREMAVRRLLGCSRKALFTRLIVESVLLCILSLLIALLLAGIAEPIFNRILQTHISVSNLFSASNLGIGVVAIILLGLLTGVIPASVITRARPIDVVRGSFRHKTKMVYNKILIGFQYLITIVLLGCTLTMSRQIDMMLHADLGFDTANKLYLSIPDLNPGQSAGLKNQLLQIAGVENVALVRGVPMLGSNNTSDTWHDRPISTQRFEGDSSYLKIMGFRILRDNRTDDRKAIWLNETAMQAMELPDSASYCEYFKCPIAGIVQDFRYRDLTHPAEPCIIEHMQDNYWPWACIIQLTNLDSPVTLRTIERVYREYTGGMPCEYKTYDEVMHQQYAAQQRMSDILFGFTLVAILISALGILAMATYFIRQRSMEIAVRKVFGSTNREVLQRLVLHFVRYVLAAFVIAVPVIWYLMHDWLSQYVLRIPFSWTIFALAGLTALAIAVATVFGQSWRAANSNPVDAMTYVAQKVSGLPTERVIGSGTILDTARLRYMMSEYLDVSTSNIHAYIMGEHGDSSFVPWTNAYVGCKNLLDLLDEKGRDLSDLHDIYTNVQQAGYEIVKRKRSTYYGIGLSLNRLVHAILDDENVILTVSAYQNNEYGQEGLYIGVPAVVNRQGIREIVKLDLNEVDQAKFNQSCETIRDINTDAVDPLL